MLTIRLGNVKSEVVGSCIPHQQIDAELSYTIGTHKDYKNTTHLYGAGSFPTGLLHLVTSLFDRMGFTYDIDDKREFLDVHFELDVPEWFKRNLHRLGKELRPYQIEAAEVVEKLKRGILNHCTGSGKTITAANIVTRVDCKVLWIVHSLDMVPQTTEELKSVFQGRINVENSKDKVHKTGKDFDVYVANIQSLYAFMKSDVDDALEFLSRFGMVIIDECDLSGAKSWQYVIHACANAPYKIGLTGTARRGDGSTMELWAVTGDIIHKFTTSEGIRKGWLARPKITLLPVRNEVDISLTKSWRGFQVNYSKTYRESIVNNSKRNEMIRQLAERYKNRQILIVVQQVAHGKIINRLVPGSFFMHGGEDDERRKSVLDKFRNGESGVLIGTSIYDRGVNIPSVDVLVLAGGGKSDSRLAQRIGRVLRISEDKDTALVFDFADFMNSITKKHSLQRISVYKSEPEYKIRVKW